MIIDRQAAFSIQFCPGQSLSFVSSCYPFFSYLLPIPTAVCSFAFLFCAPLQDSSLCSLIIFVMYVPSTSRIFSCVKNTSLYVFFRFG
uniref:Uncharacterized protein n=1 Tax=Schistosoma mansoni TaxID=6183 RepID=A0A913KVJ1_SCHMA